MSRGDVVLVTGFAPFAGDVTNPSGDLARALDGRVIEGASVRGVVLPCAFGEAITALEEAMDRLQPALVVALGQAGGRPGVSVERVAINVDDARIADNAGQAPIDRPIVEEGPVAYWSSLPIKAILAALREARVLSEVSQSAGTFVCNHVFYGLMHRLAQRGGARGGFVHVPYTPEQAARVGGGAPSLPLAEQLRAVEIVIATALTAGADVKLAAGATH
jgi:pyroglutamyl-peptidase